MSRGCKIVYSFFKNGDKNMYQGKNKTALASQQQIADALLALMHRMPYDDISVAELCREAAVSRQTFYSLFKTKSNVVRYLMQMSCEPNVPAPQPGMSHLRQMCQCYSEYITKHREIMSLLVENGMTVMIVDMLLMAFQKDGMFGYALQEDNREYHAMFLAGGLTRLARHFIQENTDPEAIEAIVYRLMSGSDRAFEQ